ncbi:seizure protein 6 homolog isoform X1 [Ornithorhynchus anatinus]|uniref:seizure protein 6 homolog isoform X1 n=1 Tax=Ornithorhynchus anatinus TaxID=9258 RepID=UPI0010A8D351|nr:seizure protein 6 homolog isoform X1 [Ornithorhynchus anatinus]
MRCAGIVLLLPLLALPAHGLSLEAPNPRGDPAAGASKPEGVPTALPTALPTPEEPAGPIRFATTAPTLKLLNHHPLLEELLPETPAHLAELRPAPSLRQGSVPLLPGIPSPFVPSPLTSLPHHGGHSVFSDLTPTPPGPASGPRPSPPRAMEVAAWTPRSIWSGPTVTVPPEPGPGVAAPDSIKVVTAAPEDPLPEARLGVSGAPGTTAAQARELGAESTGSATASGDDEDTTTTTIITTTVITTGQPPAPCSWNFTGPEGQLDSPEASGSTFDSGLDCSYYISVYPGYGVEIKVQNVSLQAGEMVTVEAAGGPEPLPLVNETLLLQGQVIRSPTNQVVVRFQGLPPPVGPGSFHFRYQAYLLRCSFPQRPAYGDMTVTSLHPGGSARFHCSTGYQLQGAKILTCLNATRPFWDAQEPVCVAACGGVIRNATIGRIVSPGYPGNYSNNLTCHWLLEAPPGQRLHLHFEKVSLAEDDDRLIIRNGATVEAPPVYDSYEVEYLPIEGLLSGTRHFFVELSTDGGGAAAGVALRYEAFEQGHCYEPFVKYGNFSSSAASYPVGTTVEFSCDPGYTLEQGSIIIECVDPHEPQWNETEPACRAVCSGEITDSAGVVLSPNWPEPYGKGQDCIWGLHVEEDKRIMLDIRVLRLGSGDVLTFYDGDDLTARVLGQFSSARNRFKLFTSMADVTIQFQSDPGASGLAYQQGFVIHFAEVPRNDTCPELPEIANGWKSPSQPELVHGTVVTFQCYPGFEVAGAGTLMCQWDLTWSEDLPTCQRVTSCRDPGDVEHSRRLVSSSKFSVGATVQYVCDKGFVLSGNALLSCHDRQAGSPKWSDRPPRCLPEPFAPCHGPGAPENGARNPEKRLYPAGATLRFSCAPGYVLRGEVSIRCVPGRPSQWSSPPPSCKPTSLDQFSSSRSLDVAKAPAAESPLDATHLAAAIFLPLVAMVLLVGVVYLYFSRLHGKSALRMPLSRARPYDHVSVESAFDNPTYETGSLSFAGNEGI